MCTCSMDGWAYSRQHALTDFSLDLLNGEVLQARPVRHAKFKDQYSSGLALAPGVHNLEGSTDRGFQQCDGYDAWGTNGFRAWIKTDSARWQRKGRNVLLAWRFLPFIGNLLLQTSVFVFSVYRPECVCFPFTAVIMHFTYIFTCVYLFNVFSTK